MEVIPLFDYNRLLDLCNEKKISISQLERELGFGTSTINKWKKSTPNLKQIVFVANYFKVSIDYLSGESDIRSKADDLFEDDKIKTIARIYSESDNQEKKMLMKILEIKFDDYFRKD